MNQETIRKFASTALLCCSLGAYQSAGAALTVGLLDDFEDGTLGGWAPPRANTSNVAGGPSGSTRALEIRPANRLAAFDDGFDIAGPIDPAIATIEVDMRREPGTFPLEMRLVLMGPGTGNRWTSALPQLLRDDGLWASYRFSILEADLVRVAGSGSYADLSNDLNRIMFRHDVSAPDAVGTPVPIGAGSFFIDNVRAVSVIPVPGAVWLFGSALVGLLGLGTRRRVA